MTSLPPIDIEASASAYYNRGHSRLLLTRYGDALECVFFLVSFSVVCATGSC